MTRRTRHPAMADLTIPPAWHRAGVPHAPCGTWAALAWHGPVMRPALRGVSAP
jgi:hypothetical protein